MDRGFLTDKKILQIADKELEIERLELVWDIFSCFTGLAYIDVANLKPDNIVTLDDKQWIMTKRQKTKVETNVLLLDIPKSIIAKYTKEDGSDSLRETLEANYRQVKQEVLSLVDSETARIKADPTLSHLIKE